MSGLQRICKLYGRMKCGDVMMVWDYVNDVSVPESEMPRHSARWQDSEKARWNRFKQQFKQEKK